MRPKKDKILHVRVNSQLDEAIQRQAEELKIPVSQLVRTMLEQRLHDLERWVKGGKDIADQVAQDMTKVAGAVEHALGAPPVISSRLKESQHRASLQPEDILGWQEITIAKDVPCAGCGLHQLPKGEQAAWAIHEGAKRYFYCLPYKQALEEGSAPDECINPRMPQQEEPAAEEEPPSQAAPMA